MKNKNQTEKEKNKKQTEKKENDIYELDAIQYVTRKNKIRESLLTHELDLEINTKKEKKMKKFECYNCGCKHYSFLELQSILFIVCANCGHMYSQ